MDYSNVKLGILDKFKVYLKRRQAEKAENERRKYEPNDDYMPDFSEADQLEQELLQKKIARLKSRDEKRQAKLNKRNHVQLLQEGQQNYKEPSNQMTQYEVKETPRYKIQEGTLDYALDQYLKGTAFMAQDKGIYDSYSILINLCALPNQEPGNNLQNEEWLIQNLENRQMQAKQQNQAESFLLQRQPKDPAEETVFFHVSKNTDFKFEKRVYLNCERKNIAALAYNLMRNFEDLDSYYLKFSSDKQTEQMDRSEQIVIYLKDDKELMDIATRIEKTKTEMPELFEGCENVNPFMKNYGGYMAYTNSPKEEKIEIQNEKNQTIENEPKKAVVYEDMKGGNRLFKKSYNQMLSTALEESLVYGINNMIMADPNFFKTVKDMKLEEGALESADVCAMVIVPEILENEQWKMNLIANMKQGLRILSQKNPTLEINGIHNDNLRQVDSTK